MTNVACPQCSKAISQYTRSCISCGWKVEPATAAANAWKPESTWSASNVTASSSGSLAPTGETQNAAPEADVDLAINQVLHETQNAAPEADVDLATKQALHGTEPDIDQGARNERRAWQQPQSQQSIIHGHQPNSGQPQPPLKYRVIPSEYRRREMSKRGAKKNSRAGWIIFGIIAFVIVANVIDSMGNS